MIVVLVVAVLLALNAITIFMFWSDKQRAIAGTHRISEADLLMMAVIGGSPGALLARRAFRHKTRKEPFSTQLLVICMLQLGAAIGFAIY